MHAARYHRNERSERASAVAFRCPRPTTLDFSTLPNEPSQQMPTATVGVSQWMAAPMADGQWSMANACGPPADSSDMPPPSPSPSCPARPSSPLTPHCFTINRTRTAGPFDCVIPRSSRVPLLNHRGPSSCRPMQGSASSRPFSQISFRLTDFLHGSLPRPGLSAALCYWVPHLLSPSPLLLSSVHGPASMGCATHIARFLCRKQGSSSFLATPTVAPPTHEIGCHNPGPSSNKR